MGHRHPGSAQRLCARSLTVVPLDDLRNKALRVAARSEIRDVRLFAVTASFEDMPDEEAAYTYSLDSDVAMQHFPQEGGLIVNGEYQLMVRQRDSELKAVATEAGEGLKTVLDLQFTMAALFVVEEPDEHEALQQEELDAFAKTTGQFALHPYAREFIADITGRMGLPQLHIGTLKLHLDAPIDS